MRPLLRSYGEIATVTTSPGRIRMKCLRILPEMWAMISWPFSSRTRNCVLASDCVTLPCTSMASSLAIPTPCFHRHTSTDTGAGWTLAASKEGRRQPGAALPWVSGRPQSLIRPKTEGGGAAWGDPGHELRLLGGFYRWPRVRPGVLGSAVVGRKIDL